LLLVERTLLKHKLIIIVSELLLNAYKYHIELTWFCFLDARRRKKCSLVMHKKKRRILPYVPTEDGARRLKQMASVATALISSGTEFCNELIYMPTMAPRSSNQAKLEEGGMQVSKYFTQNNAMTI
jgi:hypothetical protein